MDQKVVDIIQSWPAIAGGIGVLLAAAYAIVKMTKSKKDDRVMKQIMKVWNVINPNKRR